MTNCLLFDFEDSFTYNIASELNELGAKCDVLHWAQLLNPASWDELITKYQVVILGPGPGHPKDYAGVFPFLNHMKKRGSHRVWGICLGHQLMWLNEGAEIRVDPNPVHGQSVSFVIPSWFHTFPNELIGQAVNVQRYNSLYVATDSLPRTSGEHKIQLAESNGQVMASQWANFCSYQFHPESIGTSYRHQFFDFLLAYNNAHESI